MTIDLPADLEQYIHDKVDTGKYVTPAAVVEDALRLLQQRDLKRREKLDQLGKEIDIGIAEADRGELLDGGQVFDEIEAQLERSPNVDG